MDGSSMPYGGYSGGEMNDMTPNTYNQLQDLQYDFNAQLQK
jgi:hypothetical protein